MNRKSSERMRALLESRNIPKWVWGIVLLVFLAIVVFGFVISASEKSATTANLPGSNMISTTGLFFNITLKLAVVLLLIYGFTYFLKRWQGTKQGKQKKYLSVIESTYLNPRQSIHLVKAGEKLLLLGSTDQSVNCLAELENDVLIQDSAIEVDNSVPVKPDIVNNFAVLLAQSFNRH